MSRLNPIDYLNLGWIWLQTYLRLRRIWGDDNGGSPGIRVNYGLDRVPGTGEQVFGGLVKLQDLSNAFPMSVQGPNILYLVSSALPYFPLRLAKIARKAGAKIVLNQNGVAYLGWFGDGYQKKNRSMAYLHSIADHVFYQSRFCQLSAEEFLGRRKPEQTSEILYNPVNTGMYRPDRRCRRDTDITMLLSGSHWNAYRVFHAIDTLKIVSESRPKTALRIAGRLCWHKEPRKAEKEMYEYAERAGVRGKMSFFGPYAQEEAMRLMNSCSILLHTKYNDPCPRVVVEAMACGLPVVYSATGGVEELVGSEAGAGVPGPLDWEKDHPPTPDALAACVLKVVENWDEYSLAARNRAVALFGIERWIDRHRDVFTKLTLSG